MKHNSRPLVLTVTDAGLLLGVSRSTAYELVRSGDLESVQLRRRVVVPVAVVADRLGVTVPDVWLALGRDVAAVAPPLLGPPSVGQPDALGSQ